MRKLAVTALSTVALMVVGLPSTSWAAPYLPPGLQPAGLNFNTNWLFAGEVPAGNGQAVGLSEAAFVPVSLPYFRTHPHKAFPQRRFRSARTRPSSRPSTSPRRPAATCVFGR